MTATILLRRAGVQDASEMARLAGELGYSTSMDAMRHRLHTLLPYPHHYISVAERGDALHGWIAAERRLTLESGERIEIVGLIVDTRSRGTGVGRMLVAGAEQWARQLGFDTISVRSNIARDDSHPFYERLGYIRRKTQHYYAKPLNDA